MRTSVLGNGSLYIGFDRSCCLREMFWPVVGLANHIAEGKENRLILWYRGQVFDIGGENWMTDAEYGEGMSFHWRFRHRTEPLEIEIDDVVDPQKPLWVRRIRVIPDAPGKIGLYSMQHYNLGENDVGEAAFWDSGERRLYHFKGPLWVCAGFEIPGACSSLSSSGRADMMGSVAKRRDGGVTISPETGKVYGRTIDHGLIESIVGLIWNPAGETATFEAAYVLALGNSMDEAGRLARHGSRMGYEGVKARSSRYWSLRAQGTASTAGSRDTGPGSLYEVSLKVLATHCDRRGGILASCDSDIMLDYRDHYRYVWPRDAAMCASALARAGYPEFARRYLLFCRDTLSEGGFFWQRYRPDGTRGSGWHPPDLPPGQLPIQEDETALSLVTAKDYLVATRDPDALEEVYPGFIRKAARFILDYREEDGFLVKPSFDLWEERRGIFSFTQASCVAGLVSAAEISFVLGQGDEKEFLAGAYQLLQGLVLYLSDDDRGFARGICAEAGALNQEYIPDWTADASLYCIPILVAEFKGNERVAAISRDVAEEWPVVVDRTIERSKVTWKRLDDLLRVHLDGDRTGVARYQGDWYWRPHDTPHVPGNPWPVATAWRLRSGHVLGLLDRDVVRDSLSWFKRVSIESGIMPEQVSCVDGEPLSVAPLAWSQAAYLDLVNLVKGS